MVEFETERVRSLGEKYSSDLSEGMKEWFESIDSHSADCKRVLACPSLDELANSLMTGAKVSVTYVRYLNVVPIKVGVVREPDKAWVAPMVSVVEDESGRRSYLSEVTEVLHTEDGLVVKSLKTNLWSRKYYEDRDKEPSWEAVLAAKHHDTKGYSSYSWEVSIGLRFDGEKVVAFSVAD